MRNDDLNLDEQTINKIIDTMLFNIDKLKISCNYGGCHNGNINYDYKYKIIIDIFIFSITKIEFENNRRETRYELLLTIPNTKYINHDIYSIKNKELYKKIHDKYLFNNRSQILNKLNNVLDKLNNNEK